MPEGGSARPVGYLSAGGVLAEGRRGFGLLPAGDVPAPSFRRLLYTVEALRTDARSPVLQFLGVAGGEGVSSVASGFALAAAREADQPVLYVNCAPGIGASRTDGCDCVRGRVVQVAAPGLRWMDLSLDAVALSGAEGRALREEIEATRAHYAAVVLDCTGGTSAANLGLARFCDGSVLVLQAERTRMPAARAAKAELERAGGQVVGVVMTRTRQHLPRWLADRL